MAEVEALQGTSSTGGAMGGPAGPGEGGPAKKRPRVVMWSSIAVAVVLAAFVAVLAQSKPSADTTALSPLVGRPAPPVSGPAIDMPGSFSLAGLRGRWVVVNFAASWCVPCREETPQLVAFSRQASRYNAAVLGVQYDPADRSDLASFLKASGATWPVIDDPAADVSYGVHQIPESFLVDPQGRVVSLVLGEVNAAGLEKLISADSAGQ